MKNNKGSIYTILIPLILTVMLVGASAIYIYGYHYKTHNSCQHHLLRSQELLAEALTQLLSLNVQASSLRVQEAQARVELAATIAVPPAHALARAKYLAVRTKQIQLHLMQKKIITTGQAKAILETAKLKIDFRKYSAVFAGSLGIKLRVGAPKLSVHASPPSALAPIYKTSPRFAQAQKLTANWVVPLKTLLPPALDSLVKSNNMLSLQCSATIEKKGFKWQSQLSRDRS